MRARVLVARATFWLVRDRTSILCERRTVFDEMASAPTTRKRLRPETTEFTPVDGSSIRDAGDSTITGGTSASEGGDGSERVARSSSSCEFS